MDVNPDRDHARGDADRGGCEVVLGWQGYYGAQSYVRFSDDGLEWPDEALAGLLSCTPGDLADAGIGTEFTPVRDVMPEWRAEVLLEDLTWFAHGDPWHVLIGVGGGRVVIGSVSMFEGGYAGPPTLTCVRPTALPSADVDLAAVAEVIRLARRRTKRSIRICSDCDSPRYDGGCRCDALARNIIYD